MAKITFFVSQCGHVRSMKGTLSYLGSSLGGSTHPSTTSYIVTHTRCHDDCTVSEFREAERQSMVPHRNGRLRRLLHHTPCRTIAIGSAEPNPRLTQCNRFLVKARRASPVSVDRRASCDVDATNGSLRETTCRVAGRHCVARG